MNGYCLGDTNIAELNKSMKKYSSAIIIGDGNEGNELEFELGEGEGDDEDEDEAIWRMPEQATNGGVEIIATATIILKIISTFRRK